MNIRIAALAMLEFVQMLHLRPAQADDVPVKATAELLKPPAGQVLSFSERGEGVQIYQCLVKKEGPGGFTWSLKSPEAVLRDHAGKILGKHYAGPTWQGNDGSKVVGETVAKLDAPGSESIPWLLLRAKSTEGRGVFSEITFIQRWSTHGGNAPTAGCDQNRAGKEVRVPYAAMYRFYTSAR